MVGFLSLFRSLFAGLASLAALFKDKQLLDAGGAKERDRTAAEDKEALLNAAKVEPATDVADARARLRAKSEHQSKGNV